MLHQLTDGGGIGKNTRLKALTQHLAEGSFKHVHAILFKYMSLQCRTLFLLHWGQLCTIAYEQQSAVVSRIHILHQIIEQATLSEESISMTIVGNHRTLIHDKQCIACLIRRQRKGRERGCLLLSVNDAMDSVGCMARIEGKHFGSPTCGCQ